MLALYLTGEKMARRKKIQRTPLYDIIGDALKHGTDARWLGENSLLASPYLLGSSSQTGETVTDPVARGRALQELLHRSVDDLEPYPSEILQRTFFSGRDKVDGVWDELTLSRAQYFRVREEAIIELEKVLLNHLQPALRLERPVSVTDLVGREENVDHCLDALQQNLSIALIGTGGVGKTTLGSYLAHQLTPQPVFWYTFYPGFNDQLDSLLFSLGYFFHSQGVSTLWSQILAQHKESKPLDLTLAQGLIRHDLEQLQPLCPLLCLDEIDMLQISEIETHSQIRTLIESLRGQTPILLMGQQSRIETDHFFKLERLSETDIRQWLEQLQIQHTSDQLSHLYRYTEGNPRLLQLFIILIQMGASFEESITRLPADPSVEFLLNRIWQRLSLEEQKKLMLLSVFRRPMPHYDISPQNNSQGLWALLIERQLVQDDGGGLFLISAYRTVLYRLLSIDERELLHQQAGLIRAKLSDYTAAAYHYIEANQAEKAVLLWHEQRQNEINRGQARTALALFNNVSAIHLSETTRELLELIRSQLAFLIGNMEQARQSVVGTIWKTPIIELEALKLEGDLADANNELDVALYAYHRGLEKSDHLWEVQIPLLRKEAGWVYIRQREMEKAWYETQVAHYELENLRGLIQRKLGHLSQAEEHYQAALQLAKEIKHIEGIAKTYSSLSTIYTLRDEVDDAIDMNQKSIAMYEQIGRVKAVANGQANLATMYQYKYDFTEALKRAHEALKLFKIIGSPYEISITCQTLAESHLALDQLDESEKYAWQVIETEDEEGIPDAMRVLGEIELKRGNYDQAKKHIRESIRLAQENEDPFLEAYGWRALGQVYRAMPNADP